MPRLELSLELETTQPDELSLGCWACGRPGCEWKFRFPIDAPDAWRGLHTKCKIALEQKRRPSQMLPAVKPP